MTIIQDQLEQGIVERVTDEPHGEKEFYLPHKPVVGEAMESTKMQMSSRRQPKQNKLVRH